MADPKPDETMLGKVALALPGGQKVMVGSSLTGAGLLLYLSISATSFVNRFLDEAEATRAAVTALGGRMDKVDQAISALADNAERIDALNDENVRLRAEQTKLRLEVDIALACAKDRRKCP